jgi:hypothetical protein
MVGIPAADIAKTHQTKKSHCLQLHTASVGGVVSYVDGLP